MVIFYSFWKNTHTHVYLFIYLFYVGERENIKTWREEGHLGGTYVQTFYKDRWYTWMLKTLLTCKSSSSFTSLTHQPRHVSNLDATSSLPSATCFSPRHLFLSTHLLRHLIQKRFDFFRITGILSLGRSATSFVVFATSFLCGVL